MDPTTDTLRVLGRSIRRALRKAGFSVETTKVVSDRNRRDRTYNIEMVQESTASDAERHAFHENFQKACQILVGMLGPASDRSHRHMNWMKVPNTWCVVIGTCYRDPTHSGFGVDIIQKM